MKISTRTQRTILVLLGLTVAICCVSPAHADLIFTFAGEVASVDTPLDSQFTVGDTFTFTFSIDETTADTNSSPEDGVYPGVTGVSFSYSNGYTGGAASSPILAVQSRSSFDALSSQFNPTGAGVSGQTPSFIEFSLDDTTATAFTSDAIPTALDINDFDVTRLQLFFSGSAGETSVTGIITSASVTLSAVPEPSSLAVWVLGGLMLGFRGRRRILR